MTSFLDILRPALEGALRETVHAPSPQGDDDTGMAERVLDRIVRDPDLAHLANAEPWYRSRVTLGAIVSAATPIVMLVLGREVTADEQAALLAALTIAGTLAGSAVTLYGRWVARRPIGR